MAQAVLLPPLSGDDQIVWSPKLIMVNGELLPFADARIHPLSLAVTYAITVFEGLRAYHDPASGSFSLFRFDEHIRRLQTGMKLLRVDRVYELDYLRDAVRRLIRSNEPDGDAYVRLLAYVEGTGLMSTTGPVGFTAAAMPRDKPKFADTGMSLGVSSWHRLSDNASPPRIKSTANYHNARLAALQAKADGYDGALMLTSDGRVSEAPIACFFMVRNGCLITPSSSSGILESITRDTIITRWRERTGGEVEQRDVDRSELYFADEAFLCGTGQEILPITSIDRLPVGDGTIGPITRGVRDDYFGIVRGLISDHPEWRTLV
jgi:branched-chain amino acid aminotransferase